MYKTCRHPRTQDDSRTFLRNILKNGFPISLYEYIQLPPQTQQGIVGARVWPDRCSLESHTVTFEACAPNERLWRPTSPSKGLGTERRTEIYIWQRLLKII